MVRSWGFFNALEDVKLDVKFPPPISIASFGNGPHNVSVSKFNDSSWS
jgi:hypothetical protein